MKPYIAFLLWILGTLVLTFTVIGMFLFIPDEYEPSTWMKIGLKLTILIEEDLNK